MSDDTPPPPADAAELSAAGLGHVRALLAGLDRLAPVLALPEHPAAADPPVPFGRYRLLARLGAGRFGVVLLAHEPGLGRRVAVKVPQPAGFADPELRAGLVREGRAAGALDHPGIVPVFEAGECDGVPFLASGYVPGPTLERWHRDHPGPVPPADAARLVAAAAAAVHHAHERGVLHCDLTPSNVLLVPVAPPGGGRLGAYRPAVTDFGLARLTADDPALTRTFRVAGTPAYMAPEQARGERRNLTARADVYALGAILYELLTGRPPFVGGGAAEVLDRLQTEAPALGPGVPPDAAAVCLTCLTKDPAGRYPTAAELAADLGRFAAGVPVRARPPGPLRRAAAWARRRPEAAGLVALALLLGLVAALSAAREWRRVGEHNAELTAVLGREQEEARQRQAALDRERALVRTLRGHRYAAAVAAAGDLWEVHRADQARPLLAEVEPGPGDEDPREFAWHFMDRHAPERRTRRAHRAAVRAVAAAPDGRRYASAAADGEVVLWAAEGLVPTSLGRFPGCDRFELAFSPDGGRLAAVANRRGDVRLRVWDATTGRVLGERAEPAERCLAPAFAAGGAVHYLRQSAAELALVRWPAAGGAAEVLRAEPVRDAAAAHLRPDLGSVLVAHGSPDGVARPFVVERWAADPPGRRVVADPAGIVLRLAPSADGALLAVATHGQPLRGLDAATGRERFRGDEPSAGGLGLAFSPDGKVMAVERGRFVEVWDVAGGSGRRRASMWPPVPPTALAFAPDGLLVLGSADGGVGVWDLARPSGTLFLDAGSEVWAVALAPDGAVAAGADDGAVRVWGRDGRERAKRTGHPSLVTAVEYLPGGRGLVSGGYDGTVRVWDAAGGPGRELAPRHAAPVTGVAVSADGRRAASRGRDGAVRVWELPAGRHLRDLPGNREMTGAVAFAPDGRTLAVAAGGDGLRLWDVEAGQAAGAAAGVAADFTWSVAFAPDGRTVATGHDTGAVRLWDVGAAEPRAVLCGHAGGVRAVAFSPDGRSLASGGDDATVRLWHPASGRPLLTLREGHRGKVSAVRFSADGRSLASGSHDGTIRVW